MNTKFPELKQELKELAQIIRELKATRGPANCGHAPGLFSAQYRFRESHVIYCMAHGTPYERIESPERADALDMKWIEEEVTRLQGERNEALRACMQEAV